MAPKSKKVAAKKIAKVMKEWKAGALHSGSKSGPMVKSRKQAIAISMSEAGIARPGMKKVAAKKTVAKKTAKKSSTMKETYKSPAAKKKHEAKESPKKKAAEKKMGRS